VFSVEEMFFEIGLFISK